jgi:hypothetical protein
VWSISEMVISFIARLMAIFDSFDGFEAMILSCSWCCFSLVKLIYWFGEMSDFYLFKYSCDLMFQELLIIIGWIFLDWYL